MATAKALQLCKPLNATEEAILTTVSLLRYASVEEIMRCHFSKNSRNHAREVVTKLSGGGDWQETGYLLRFPMPTVRGNAPRIVCLSRRGAEYLRENGVPVRWYCRPDKIRNHSFSYMTHQLTVSRLLVCMQVFCRENPAYQLAELLTGYDISRDAPVTTMTVDGQEATVSVIPDVWAYLERAADGRGTALWIEIDNNGTEYRRKFQDLVAARLALIKSGQYEKYFGTPVVLLCYLVTGRTSAERKTRLRAICRWTKAVLAQEKLKDWASVFRFAVVQKDMYTTPLFAAPLWYRLYSFHRVRLFDPLPSTEQPAASGLAGRQAADKETTDGDPV